MALGLKTNPKSKLLAFHLQYKSAQGVLKEELAETFVHMARYAPKRREWLFAVSAMSVGNVDRMDLLSGTWTTNVSNMSSRVEPVNNEVETAQSLCNR